jgi:hypothetical protein
LRRRSTLGGASDQLPTSPEIASFSLSFGPASDFRRRRVLKSSFGTNFQSFIGHLVFQLTFQPTSSSRRILHRPVLPSNPTPSFRWLSHSPTFLSDRPPACARYRILQFCLPTNFRLIIGYRVSDFAFRSASDLRQRSIFQLCPPNNFQLALAVDFFRLSLRMSLRLASATAFSGSVSDQPSTSFGVWILQRCRRPTANLR